MSLKPREINFDEVWEKVKETLLGVITLAPIARHVWNDRFSDVYSLCVAFPEPQGEKLYAEIKTFLENHVQEIFKIVSHPDADLLTLYNYHWMQFSQGSSYLNLLFRFLNQYLKKQKHEYCPGTRFNYTSDTVCEDLMDIGELALDIWKKIMLDPLKEPVVKGLLDDIERDRNGEEIPQKVVHGIIQSFVAVQEFQSRGLQLYEEVFEKEFLLHTGEYYKRESVQLLAECTSSVYLQKVDMRLQDENMRARRFLHPVSYSKVIRECENKLMEDHLEYLQVECRSMVREERKEDLCRMYTLLKPIPKGLSTILDEVCDHIETTGLSVVERCGPDFDPTQYIESLLQVYKKFKDVVDTLFSADKTFYEVLDKACNKIVNHGGSSKKSPKSPELLARYCDLILKKSNKNLTETEIDEKLSDAVIIFRYVDDKDVFQKFYSKMLAKRLIHNLSVSMDAEEGMINRLKTTCGYEYTSRLQRMFNDMRISSDLNSNFDDYLRENHVDIGLSITLLILQSGAWPLGQTVGSSFTIPHELVKPVQMFEKFYNGRFSGRKLTWLNHLCTGEMKMNFLKRPYIITVTNYQMGILLLFNDPDAVSYWDMLAMTGLEEKELKRTIQSLIDVKILLKSEEQDFQQCRFTINKEFSSKRTKLKVTSAVQRETQQELDQTHTAIDEDRKLYLQAAIVRVMKSRKIIKHNILIQEVISQSRVRFSPSVPMIKKCIEALIEKQYIERYEGSKDEYSYIA